MPDSKIKEKNESHLSWAKEFFLMGLNGELNIKMDEYRKSLIEEFGTDELDKITYDIITGQYIKLD